MKTLKSQLTTCHPHLSSTSLPFLSKPTLNFRKRSLNFKVCNLHPISSSSQTSPPSAQPSSSLVSGVGLEPTPFPGHFWNSDFLEEAIEKVIYRFRFVAFLGVFGSLIGSLLCFIKGCGIVAASFIEYFAKSGKVVVMVVEAIDIYLLGTVMLIFGMGLYELFVSNLDIAKSLPDVKNRSSLFGLFPLLERPRWLEIKSVSELKTKPLAALKPSSLILSHSLKPSGLPPTWVDGQALVLLCISEELLQQVAFYFLVVNQFFHHLHLPLSKKELSLIWVVQVLVLLVADSWW
ncbi:hypothetical protein SOVF_126190 [Spinacia oleracea]|nr:hypothetical protein SOVF_126190 [Spinacia oleracea]